MTDTAERCIRRAGSTWTTCTCQDCRRWKSRSQKLYRCGRLQLPDRDAAMLRLQTWVDRGWQPSAIASATGITAHGAQQLLWRLRNGGLRYLQGCTVERILNARRPTEGRIDACGPRRRLQALAWMGWTLQAVHERTGIPMMTLSYLRSGQINLVAVRTINAITDLYDQVQNTPGGSKWSRSVVAERKGWAPPAAWDEDTIDDPAAEPEGVDGPGRNAVDDVVIARVRELALTGHTDEQIGLQVALSTSGVQKLRSRYGITRAVAA